MSDIKKELHVSAIENGTVIDHIPAEYLFKVINILGLESLDNFVTFGKNLESKKQGKKAIIKIADKYFENNDINKIALIAPEAVLNIIKNYKVVEKRNVVVPDNVVGIVNCYNPKCITNNEEMITKFDVINKQPTALKCCYCEKITEKEYITFK